MVRIEGTRTCNVRRCRKITLHTLTCELWIILGAGCRHRRRRRQPTKIIYLYFSILLLFISFSIFLLSCLHTYLGRLSRARSRSSLFCSDCICFYTISNWKCYDFSMCCYCPCRCRCLSVAAAAAATFICVCAHFFLSHLFICSRTYFFCFFLSFYYFCVVWTRARR